MHSRIFFQGRRALAGNESIRDPAEIHHAVNVLRLKTGDAIEMVDGEGGSVSAEISEISKTVIRYEVTGSKRVSPPGRAFDLAFSLLKGSANDRIIRFGAELAVRRFIPLITSRTVGWTRGESDGKLERWNRIAVSAMKQSGRLFLPSLERPAGIEQLGNESDRYDKKFFACVKAESGSVREIFPCDGSVIGVIGPEGGFSDTEADILESMGFLPVSLGPTRLRAETAALVVCAEALLSCF